MRLLLIPGTKSFEPEKYSSKHTAGVVQHVPELELVPPGLIGQRLQASTMFMSVQYLFCRTAGSGVSGTTGVNETTLSVTMPSTNRAGKLIGRI